MEFLRRFDQISFWLGFLAGTLFVWIGGKLLPGIKNVIISLSQSIKEAREGLATDAETRHRNDVIQYVQKLHLASPLFSLEEIVITPRLIAPPPRIDPVSEDEPPSDIVNMSIPYMPDWPQLSTTFGAPMLTIAEAMEGGANLVITGNPGMGKTVALAHLALQVARGDPKVGDLSNLLPIYIHAADLELDVIDAENPLDPLIAVLEKQASFLNVSRLPDMVRAALKEKKGLLLIDGLDELPHDRTQRAVAYLEIIVENFPDNRIIAAASNEFYDGITALNCIPVPIAAWDYQQKNKFIQKWDQIWSEHISNYVWEEDSGQLDALILKNWLQTVTDSFTPLDITLETWAAYAGDTFGPAAIDSYEAYLRRMTTKVSNAKQALEDFALQVTLNMVPDPHQRQASNWLRGKAQVVEIEAEEEQEVLPILSDQDADSGETEQGEQKSVGRNVLSELINSGLLVGRHNANVSLAHPVLTGYLAGRAMGFQGGSMNLINQPDWSGKSLGLHFLASQTDVTGLTTELIDDDNFLHQGLLTSASWLNHTAKKAKWRGAVMRSLVSTFQKDYLAMGIRGRVLTAMVTSRDPGVSTYLSKLLIDSDPVIRQLATIGLGFLREKKATNDLTGMLSDPVPSVRRAACLSLVAIGTQEAIEAVTSVLVHGDEDLQRAAAEALSYHPEEGHEILKEATTVDDLLVRRAAVFGLVRVSEPWTHEILERVAIEDGQWVVRNAAQQAVEMTHETTIFAPTPYPPLHETPWLIKFAGESGEGISPGKGAKETLFRALKHGNEEQRLAAMDYLKIFPDESFIPTLYDIFFSNKGDLREAALDTLWHMKAAGVELPSPTQYGLG